MWIGLGGVLLAILLGLLAQAGQATGAELALPWAPAMVMLLSTTRLGLIWLAQAGVGAVGDLVGDGPAGGLEGLAGVCHCPGADVERQSHQPCCHRSTARAPCYR